MREEKKSEVVDIDQGNTENKYLCRQLHIFKTIGRVISENENEKMSLLQTNHMQRKCNIYELNFSDHFTENKFTIILITAAKGWVGGGNIQKGAVF